MALVIRRLFWRGASEPFLIELPSYKVPDPKNILRGLLAARADLPAPRRHHHLLDDDVGVVPVELSRPRPPAQSGPAIDYSLAGMLGHAIAPLLAPIGFSWQMTLALIPGFAAREVCVGVLGTVYSISDASQGATLATTLAGQWSLASALAFLAWYIFAPQCASTLGVVKRETNSWRWPVIMFTYMITLAYLASFATYHIAVALGAG